MLEYKHPGNKPIMPSILVSASLFSLFLGALSHGQDIVLSHVASLIPSSLQDAQMDGVVSTFASGLG